jgi:transcription elongation factor GreB
MGRYRAPQKPGAKYITAEGEKALKAELHQLWKVERPVVTQSVSDAAALGDRSENAEYIYGKKRLREIDRRVRYLSKRLEEMTVVSEPPENQSKIYFSATVTLEDEDSNQVIYKIVGPDELDPQKGHISVDAPLGRALLGKEVDSEIEIDSPQGKKIYYVLAISY